MNKMPLRVDVAINLLKIKKNVFCDEVVTVLKKIRPTWFKDDQAIPSTLKAKNFTEGITNLLHGYYQDERFEEDLIMVRVDGEGTEDMVNRDQEIKNIQALSAVGMSPPLYAVFNNGIAYGFVYGNTLDCKDLTDGKMRKLIAKEMIAYHSVQPDGPKTTTDFFDKVSSFLEMSPDRLEDPAMQARLERNIKPKAELRKEFQELRAHLESLNSPVVFCHNDLLPKNIIYNDKRDRISFIDHEFAMYNYEHYELGNHFCEYAGIHNDFSLYPNKDYQMDWLRYYLEQKAIHNGESPDTVTDKDVEICYVKTNKFALVAHMFCGLFGLIQAKNSSIDFGFLEYGELKLGEYFSKKEEFLALKLPK